MTLKYILAGVLLAAIAYTVVMSAIPCDPVKEFCDLGPARLK